MIIGATSGTRVHAPAGTRTAYLSAYTTVEMAALNVDPATHRRPWNPDGTANLTTTFRDKHSFREAVAPGKCGKSVGMDAGRRQSVRVPRSQHCPLPLTTWMAS
jgi:hypothetical protein